MECWRLLFAVKQRLLMPGEGKSGQNWPSFVRRDPVGSNMKDKLLTQTNVNCNMFHITFGFFLSDPYRSDLEEAKFLLLWLLLWLLGF